MRLDAATDAISWTILLSAFVTFPVLLNFSAPYGRYTKVGWGPFIAQRWAWLTQELPSFLIPILILGWSICWTDMSARKLLPIAMFIAHYTWRALGYPFIITAKSDTPFSVWLLAFIFCCLNGFQQASSCLFRDHVDVDFDLLFILGGSLWGFGWAVNLHSDSILQKLRRTPGCHGYGIPYGGAFEYVSAANYFGEIVEWAGWALACRSLASLSFAVFTFANLAPRGWHHHKFYLRRFPQYPKGRRAIIPFVW